MMTSRSRMPVRSRGFSLIELLLAIFILGVGIISVASVFPVGIVQQRKAQDDVVGPVVAESALAVLRSHLSPEDFGAFEEFAIRQPVSFALMDGYPNSMDTFLAADDTITQAGDWPWLRPSMAVVPAGQDPADYAGDIDIFSARSARAFLGGSYPSGVDWVPATRTTEFVVNNVLPVLGDTFNSGDGGAFLYGIPYSRKKYSLTDGDVRTDPLVTISQESRFWPLGSGFESGQPRPDYAWDCMFRRFQGRIQVAIFVYRIGLGGATGYAPAKDLGTPAFPRSGSRPVIPARFDFPLDGEGGPLLDYAPLTPEGDPSVPLPWNNAIVPGTGPVASAQQPDPTLDSSTFGWQAPGQWLLDPYGRVHRVLQGRANARLGPVRLARPVAEQPASASLWNWRVQNVSSGGDIAALAQEKASEVRSLWFIPPVDRQGVSLTPIYVAVRDL